MKIPELDGRKIGLDYLGASETLLPPKPLDIVGCGLDFAVLNVAADLGLDNPPNLLPETCIYLTEIKLKSISK